MKTKKKFEVVQKSQNAYIAFCGKEVNFVIMILFVLLCFSGCSGNVSKEDVVIEDLNETTPIQTEDTTDITKDSASEANEEDNEENNEAEEGNEDSEEDNEAGEDLKGIIAMQREDYNISIICINPETGVAKEISSFELNPRTFFSTGGLYANFRDLFSKDFDKLAISQMLESEEHSAGWIDTDGEFYNVSEAAGYTAEGDFDEKATDFAVGFHDNGKNFVFLHDAGNTCILNFELIHYADVYDIDGGVYQPKKKDSYIKLDDISSDAEGNHIGVTDKLSDGRYIVDWGYAGGNENFENEIHGCRSMLFSPKTKNVTELFSNKSERDVWSGVADPAEHKVAFLSLDGNNCKDENVKIHIVSLDGGKPEELKMNSENLIQLTCNKRRTSRETTTFCTLLDWR